MVYAVDLCYYTEENVPECGAVVFIRSDKDITELPTHIIKENIFVEEAMELNDCKGIGNIFELTEEEFYEEYPNENLIEWEEYQAIFPTIEEQIKATIKELKNEIKYEKRKMKGCAYGNSDLTYLYGLEKELKELKNKLEEMEK